MSSLDNNRKECNVNWMDVLLIRSRQHEDKLNNLLEFRRTVSFKSINFDDDVMEKWNQLNYYIYLD